MNPFSKMIFYFSTFYLYTFLFASCPGEGGAKACPSHSVNQLHLGQMDKLE